LKTVGKEHIVQDGDIIFFKVSSIKISLDVLLILIF
jgi:hypothetical protein